MERPTNLVQMVDKNIESFHRQLERLSEESEEVSREYQATMERIADDRENVLEMIPLAREFQEILLSKTKVVQDNFRSILFDRDNYLNE